MNENYENNENFDYMLPQGIPQEESVQNVDDGQQSTQTFFDMHPFQEYKTLDEAQELAERQLRNNVRKLTEEGWLPVSQQKDENLLFNGTNADGTLMFYNPNIHGAIDPETGRRTVQLINPVTMEKQIGYTIDELPELVVDGLMGGIERNVDGSPKIDKKTNSVIDTYLRDWYKENKDYVDQLSDQDREELFRYLMADHYEDQMKNTKMMFDGQEIHPNYSIVKSSTPNPPKVYTDYVNHVIDEAYKSTDQLAWLGGPFSAAYYAPRALQDLLRERYAGALENGTMAVLPFVGRGAGLGKQVASFAAAGLPLSAYYAYEGSPEEALITLGSFAAMPVLGKAVHEMNVPAASAAVADMLKEAADKGAIGYYSALAQLSRVFKNATGDMKVLRDKSFKQIENGLEELKEFGKVYGKTLREELSDFRFPQDGGNNGQPALAYATTDGAYVPYRDLNANKYIFDPKDQIMKNNIIGEYYDKTLGYIGKKAKQLGNYIEGRAGKQAETIQDNSLNANTGNSTITTESREQLGEAGKTGEEIEQKKVNEDNIKQDDNIEHKQPVTSELIKELGRARIANENGDAEILEKLDLNKVKNRRGSEKDAYIERDGKKISVKTIYEDEILPSSLNDDFEKLDAMINQEIDPSKRTIGQSIPTLIKGTAGTKLSKYPDYNSVRETNIEAIKSTNGKVNKNTYRIIENDLNELTKGIKVEYTESGLSIAKDTSGWKNLTKKQQEKIDDLFTKLKDLYTKMGFDFSGLNGSSYTFYDLMYPQFGKCRPLKRAIKELNSKKYKTEYDKKLGNDSYKGWIEDGIWSAFGAGLGYYYSPDPQNTAVNTTTAIGGAVALPLLVRGLQRRGAFARSPLGSSINKVLPDRVAPYYQKTPERFQMLDKVPGIIKYGIPGLIIGGGAIGKRNQAVNHGYDSTQSMFVPWHDYESGNTPNNDPMEVYYSDEKIKELNNK